MSSLHVNIHKAVAKSLQFNISTNSSNILDISKHQVQIERQKKKLESRIKLSLNNSYEFVERVF